MTPCRSTPPLSRTFPAHRHRHRAIQRRFYESVFGWPITLEVPEDADDATREQLWFLFGGVIYRAGDSGIALRPGASDDRFDEDRTGLDHLAFRCRRQGRIEGCCKHLDGLGIEHEPIKDIGMMYILEFRDPDNIALELVAPK